MTDINDGVYNMNDMATVILTDEGNEIFKTYYPGWKSKKVEFPLWGLFEVFGEHFHLGGEPLFVDNSITLQHDLCEANMAIEKSLIEMAKDAKHYFLDDNFQIITNGQQMALIRHTNSKNAFIAQFGREAYDNLEL